MNMLNAGMALFLGSIVAGWWLRRQGRLSEARARRIIRWAMRWLSPVVLALSFWRLPLTGSRLGWLPVIGFLVSVSTLAPAYGYARRAKLTDPQIGSFLTCAYFSNVGYLGAFLAFVSFGEVAYGLAVLYLVLFTPAFYSLGFWIARHFGRGHHSVGVEAGPLEELRVYPFLGMLAGLLLNLAGVARPQVFTPLNQALIPLDTALYLVAIGAHLHVVPSRSQAPHSLAMAAIKFLYTPAVGFALVRWFRLDALSAFVVLLQCAMPVAISPLMLTVFFGLDRRLTSALFLVTTILAIPWLLVYLPLVRSLAAVLQGV